MFQLLRSIAFLPFDRIPRGNLVASGDRYPASWPPLRERPEALGLRESRQTRRLVSAVKISVQYNTRFRCPGSLAHRDYCRNLPQINRLRDKFATAK
jgi:hypothetical protein